MTTLILASLARLSVLCFLLSMTCGVFGKKDLDHKSCTVHTTDSFEIRRVTETRYKGYISFEVTAWPHTTMYYPQSFDVIITVTSPTNVQLYTFKDALTVLCQGTCTILYANVPFTFVIWVPVAKIMPGKNVKVRYEIAERTTQREYSCFDVKFNVTEWGGKGGKRAFDDTGDWDYSNDNDIAAVDNNNYGVHAIHDSLPLNHHDDDPPHQDSGKKSGLLYKLFGW